ncbi:MAG: hypothetical protein OEZ43_19435 [Gammaproteobacteria bacterium]|nr:hypothetical protein [Gammaproteobacteria bacterium]
MRQIVSKFFNGIKTHHGDENRLGQNGNIIRSTGVMVYHIERRGYFSIEAEDGTQYYPFNSKKFPKLLKDRLRVRFTLEFLPGVSNYYRNGKTVRIINMEPLPQTDR